MVTFAPEAITTIGRFPITNTLLNTLFVDGVILGSVYALNKNFKTIPNIFQNVIEMLFDTFYNFIHSVAEKNTDKIFPYVVSFFLFILIANWSGLIPGFTTIGFFHGDGHEKEFIPFMRNATSDLNVTLGLALISLFATHMLGIQTVGLKDYLSRYFSLNPVNLFVGLLEIISEFTKIVSLSFRLFGNIFAGEIVLSSISKIFAFGFPIPFLFLEIIIGLVQALVFSLLTMVFMSILMTPHHAESKEVSH